MFKKSFIATVALGTSLLLANGAEASTTHQVQNGDTLWKIAQKYDVSIQSLKEWNDLNSDMLLVNQTLIVEKEAATYTVVTGDTLKIIASKYGITLNQLLALNPQITDPNNLNIGQTINVPEKQSVANKNVGSVNTGSSFYTIQNGDYLSAVAKKLQVSYAQLIQYNPQIENPHTIFVGQTINVPTEDFVVLSKIIHLEAEAEPMEGKIAVGNVILNRVVDPTFPNTIKEVVYQKGQFSPVSNGSMDKLTQPSASAIAAARRALLGEAVVPSYTLFFFAPAKTSNSFVHSREVVADIGGHRFTK